MTADWIAVGFGAAVVVVNLYIIVRSHMGTRYGRRWWHRILP